MLSSNPIGASGMIRFAEAAMQVRGMAGEHQVDGARNALGHAYGGGRSSTRDVGGERGQALGNSRRLGHTPARSLRGLNLGTCPMSIAPY